ncbi:MAG TPA: tetratricopeptide repeat protein [Caulobacteraceae bacterium]|nr:tetratricopeptide repeat protein [Caulobacteraceae bacterium]
MVDFIEEVEEQLRADRYRALARRTLPWFLAALAAIIVGWLGAWGYQTWNDRNVAKASAAYDKALTALAQGDQTGAFTGFDQVGKTGPAGYKSLALMQQGNIRLMADKTDEAVGYYDQAAKAAPTPLIGDLARLKAAMALMDTAPYAQIETRLKPLIGDKKPFDLNAREALAMAKLAAGKTAEARTDCAALTLMLGVTQGIRERCQAMMSVIDSGQAKTVVQVAKTAATLPPPPPPSLGAAQGAPSPGPDQSPNAPRTAQ